MDRETKGGTAWRGGVDAVSKTVRQIRADGLDLDAATRALAVELLDRPPQGNAVVERRLLVERGIPVRLRVQRVLTPHRRARLAAEVATMRFETAPGWSPSAGPPYLATGVSKHACASRTGLARRARPSPASAT